MDTIEIVLIAVLVVVLISYLVVSRLRYKKDYQSKMEMINSLKRGDKVLTVNGVYGTIVDLQLEGDMKIVTLETGTTKNKGYISVDAFSIYSVINDEEKQEATIEQNENKAQELASELPQDEKFYEIEEQVKPKRSKKKNS